MYQIFFALVLLMIATPGTAEVDRSSMNLGVIHWAQAQYRYKRPPVSNIDAKEFPVVVREFRHDRVLRDNFTHCLVTAFVPNPVTGSLGARIGETTKPVANEAGICDETSYKLGREMSRYLTVPPQLLDSELMVIPSGGVSNGKIEKDILTLARVAEVTALQDKCIGDLTAAFRTALVSEYRSWLTGLGAKVSIDLIDNSAGLDLEQHRRTIGITYSGESDLSLRATLGPDGKCSHPSALKLQEILQGMTKWANAPKTSEQWVYWHK